MLVRWANAVAAAIFILSAALQYNDPDPWAWGALYLAAGFACALRGHIPSTWLQTLALVVGAAAAIWAFILAPQALAGFRLTDLARTMKAGTPAIELSRELLGLVIVLGWMAVLTATAGRALSTPSSS